MGRFISDAAKRALDLLCVVLGGPFVLGIAAYTRHRIKKDSPGDAIYSGKRLGKNGVLFPCYKFRSMYTNGDEILEQYYLEHPEKKAEYEKYHKLDNSLDGHHKSYLNEIIKIEGKYLQISTTALSHKIYEDCNYIFPRIVNDYNKRKNVFTIEGICSLKMQYRPIRKVGV